MTAETDVRPGRAQQGAFPACNNNIAISIVVSNNLKNPSMREEISKKRPPMRDKLNYFLLIQHLGGRGVLWERVC